MFLLCGPLCLDNTFLLLLYYKHSVVLLFPGSMELGFCEIYAACHIILHIKTTAFHPNFVLAIPNVFLILLSLLFSVGNEPHFLRGETVFI